MIESKDLNYYGKSIGTIIIFLVFIIGLIIIIDEFYNLTKFCYKYTYLYNFGNMNEATCRKDNNNIISLIVKIIAGQTILRTGKHQKAKCTNDQPFLEDRKTPESKMQSYAYQCV